MKTKLRRVAILALVLVLLTSNTIGAQASTTEYSASSYEELVVALEQAENMDTIAISSVIVIPKGSTLGDSSKQVIIKYEGSAYMELELDNDFTATSTITNLIFDGELGTSLYPMLRARGKADFVNCTFKGASKGTVYSGYADLSFTGCTFSYNEGTYGGHFNAGYNTTAVFDRCSFSYGTSTTKGGGIHIDSSTSYVTLRNCIITANESVYGGGIYNDGNLTLENTLLYNNHASTGGDDLCTSTATYDLGTLEAMEQEFRDQSILIKPLSWETSTAEGYGYECYKLLYTTATTEEPTDPDEGDNTDGDTEDGDTTTPEDPDTGDNEEPTTPDGGDDTTDPSTPPDEGGDNGSGEDPVEPEAPSDTEQGDNIDNSVTDNSVTDNSDHSTTDNSDHSSTDNSTTDNSITDNSQSSTDNSVTDNSTTDNSTVDNSITDNSTHTEDNSGSGNTTDNSTHSSTTDNSQHSSTVDNSSVVSNTDNSSSRSESSNTENSNNTTTYNYYQTEQDKGSTGAPQSISQPITINVTVPQAKEPETSTQELTEASQSIAQNIHIEAEGVNVKYEYTADGVSISISPYIAPESPTEAEIIPTAYAPVETPQEPAESPISWVDYVSMILLAILVLSELRDRWMRLKTKAE